jgi:hypothetical protein
MGRRRVGFRIVLNLLLDVQRQVDQHRALSAFPHNFEGLSENPRDHGRILDAVRLLGDRLNHLGDVHRLEGFPVKLSAHVLAGERQYRDRVHLGRVEACNEVAGARA